MSADRGRAVLDERTGLKVVLVGLGTDSTSIRCTMSASSIVGGP
jgi:hypothetical protein